jgi:DNA primase
MKNRDLLDLAANYHKAMPQRIRRYLNNRGIPDVVIDFHLLGWSGWRITIPIFNQEGEVTFFKLAKDPEDRLPGPKMMASYGSSLELYGWEQVKRKPSQIIICEGEFDRLVLQSNGFYAVTSTGGAGAFRPEWAKEFEVISEVYICFDRDEAGRNGAIRVGRMISRSRLIELPEEVGEGGDVTDFFVRLGKTKEDFFKLMEQAQPAPPQVQAAVPENLPRIINQDSPLGQKVREMKTQVAIERVIGQYIKLQSSGDKFVGLCPFHDDHDPSFTVYPATGTFHCYGCNKHGDVITFLREIANLSFSQALDVLDQLRSQYESGPQQDH